MRTLVCGLAVAYSLLLTGCGADDEQATSSPAAAPSTSTAPVAPTPAEAGATPVLTGTVGTTADPDAFEITLTDEAGKPVETLPAGAYQIEVEDLSEIHNFHLEGGGVDESTSVREVVDTTFDVTLEPGNYRFVCDPHPGMAGELTVT